MAHNRAKKTLKFLSLDLILCLVFYSICGNSFALPKIDQIVSGSARIINTDKTTLTILASDKTIINYKSFDVKANESVIFNLPSEAGEILNRVIGPGASLISGNLISNGIVMLVNKNGITFGPNANISASGFLASTRDITNSNFLNSNYVFEKMSKKQKDILLLNQGKINIQEGGFGVFIAGAVDNTGTILAPLGSIAVAGAEMVTLNMIGNGMISLAIEKKQAERVFNKSGAVVLRQINNSGTISAPGGIIMFKAESLPELFEAAINLDGFVRADSFCGLSGSITIDTSGGINAKLFSSGRVDAAANSLNIVSICPLTYIHKKGDILLKSSVLLDEMLINLAGEGISVIYCKDHDIVLHASGVIDTTDGIIIEARSVRLLARRFGDTGSPIAINAANASIEKLNGDMDILESFGFGSTILLRGPPENGFGSFIYNTSTNLTLKAQNGRILIAPGAFIYCNDLKLFASGDIKSYGAIKSNNLIEQAATFLLEGTCEVLSASLNNVDNAVTFGTGNYSGTYSDAVNIVINSNSVITLTGDTIFRADSDANGTGAFIMNSGSLIAAGGHDLRIYASQPSTLGSITNAGMLRFRSSRTGMTPVYTASSPLSANTVNINSSILFMNSNDLNVNSLLIYSSGKLTGANYYVDSNSGNDANTGTSIQKPWKTIQKVNDYVFQPKDNILFKRGCTWNLTYSLDIQSGSADGNIVYGAYGSGDKPLFRVGYIEQGIRAVGDSFFIIKDMQFSRGMQGKFLILAQSCKDFTIQNCYLTGNNLNYLLYILHDSINGDCSNITIDSCVFENANAGAEGIRVGIFSNYRLLSFVTISNCSFNNITGNGIYVYLTSERVNNGMSPQNFNITGNVFNNIDECALIMSSGRNFTISNNICSEIGNVGYPNINAFQLCNLTGGLVEGNVISNVYTSVPDGNGIILDWGYHNKNYLCSNNIIRNNKVSGCFAGSDSNGISAYKCVSSFFYNNIIFDCSNGIGVSNAESSGNSIYNNTICNVAVSCVHIKQSAPSVTVKNNIFSSAARGIKIERGASVPVEDYNCFYNMSSGNVYDSNVSRNIPIGVNSITGDPLLDGEFVPAPDSPCKDEGDTLLIVADDFSGKARPFGSAYDMGAYEIYLGQLLTFSGTGNWSSPSLWSSGQVPGSNDTVIIDGICTLTNNVSGIKSLTINYGRRLDLAGFNIGTIEGINNNGALYLLGNESIGGTVINAYLSAVQYRGSGNYTGLSAGNSYYYLRFSGTGSWTLNQHLNVNNNLTIMAGNTLHADGKTITVSGDWSNSGSFYSEENEVVFNGNTVMSGSSKTYFSNVRINQGKVLTGPRYGYVYVSGDWANNGIFNANSGTITLIGTELQEIDPGNSVFNTLTIRNSSSGGVAFISALNAATLNAVSPVKKISFAAGTGIEHKITKKFNVSGNSTNLLVLAPLGAGQRWFISAPVSTVKYVVVSFSQSSGAITARNSIDGGNNTGWSFQ